MASSLLETTTLGVVEWTPRRRAIDPRAFDCGRVGPYCLGPEFRSGLFGPVHFALGAHFDAVLELERVDVAGFEVDRPQDSLGARVLERVNHCVGLSHPHVARILGAGLDDGTPYVLRAHALGRTLADLALADLKPPPDVAAGILYSVADGVGFLADAGPAPGICGVGGVGSETVYIGFDGNVTVLGAGLALLRDDRPSADFEGLRRLARALEPSLGDLVDEASNCQDATTRLRRWRRDACANRRSVVGAWIRRAEAEACDAYRRFFSLEPLH